MTRTVLFLCADETANAGERDYMLAIAAEIKARGAHSDIDYRVVKIHGNTEPAQTVSELPLTNADYAALPMFNSFTLQGIKSELEIVGVGNSTFDALKAMTAFVEDSTDLSMGRPTWITHMVGGGVGGIDELDWAMDKSIRLFLPMSFKQFQGHFGAYAESRLHRIDFQEMDAVPHTNTEASCDMEWEKMKQGPHGDKLNFIEGGFESFVCVVLNAGFDIGEGEDKFRASYTPNEAKLHGRALGTAMPRANLVIVHGGPRNLRDDEQNDCDTMDVFVKAYQEGQLEQRGGERIIVADAFQSGYNAVKAVLSLAMHQHCIGFVSNAEGYSTMDAATLLLDNNRMTLGMFPFCALHLDPTGQRQTNIEKYQDLGIDVLCVKDGRLILKTGANRQRTPGWQRSPAEQIVTELGLATFAPSASPPFARHYRY